MATGTYTWSGGLLKRDTISNVFRSILYPRQGSHAVVQTVITKGTILAVNAATGIISARALHPTARGELSAMILWPVFLSSALSLGVPSSLVFNLKQNHADHKSLLSAAVWMGLILGSLAGLIGALAMPHLLAQYPSWVVHAAQLFMITTPVCTLMLVGRATLETRGDFLASNVVQLFTPLPTLAVLILLVIFGRMTPISAGLAYTLSGIPIFLWMVHRLYKTVHIEYRIPISHIKSLLHYGIRSYGIDLLGTLAVQVDQVLVINLLNPAAMGTYVVALSLSRVLNVFQYSAVMVLFPRAAGRSVQEVVSMTERAARLSTAVTAACAVLVALLGPILLKLLYGSAYAAASSALRILVIEVVFSGLVFVLSQTFMALGKPGLVTMLQGTGLALSVPLMLLFIPRFGIEGAALALLCSTLARTVLVMGAFRYVLGVRKLSLIPTWTDLRNFWQMFVAGPGFSNPATVSEGAQ
jgi:O-antigen/teichoic acid export membrane protein